MILDLVRMKVNAARSKIVSIVITTLISGLLVSIPVPAFAAACNPTSTTVGSDTVLTFTEVGTCDWTVPAGVASVRTLVVAGGGAGGGGWTTKYFGNGGGGGEVIDSTLSVTADSIVSIKVGAGGAATSYDTNSTSVNNGDTSFFGTTTARAGTSTFDKTSRVGGTSGSLKTGGTGSSTVVEGGGGGGAGSNGSGRNGGAGVSSNISGTSKEYGGGGASMGHNGTSPQYGTATGGGGAPSTYSVNAKGTATATANTGGGGGGDNGVAGGGAGGSGVVVVRFTTPIECSPTSTIVGSDTVLTFSDSGSCVWEVPTGVTAARVLVVGAGGGGGSSLGGGGGGGEVVSQNSVSVSGALTIKVGAGGIGGNGSYTSTTNNGKTGSSSSITGGSLNIAALGGSGGNGRSSSITRDSSGYTGGGGAYPNGNSVDVATTGSGGPNYKGGDGSFNGGGGGGGAGGPGVARGNGSTPSSNASSGGIGLSDSITGTSTYYGGGGGASWYGGPAAWTGAGGLGGGGQGANGNSGSADGGDGTANKGGGGGGGYDGTVGGDGGSGVVIVRYGQPAGTSVLTFNANNGTGSDAAVYLRSATSETLPSKTKITRPGFEFTGWNTNANGSGTPYALGGTITISVNTTLYAQWSRNTSPSCAANVGKGGSQSTTLASTKAGNGCVGISFVSAGVNSTITFNYTGADQSWTVPTGVTSATFYLFGAGGGGNTRTSGGGGGYATGAYSVTAGQVYTVIVGEGGGAETAVTVAGLTGKYTKVTYGGGGRGGSTAFDTYIGTFASGGGRSAIRVQGATTDLATAAGGGGGGYGVCGFGGGGLSGVGERGGTQTAGGASASVSLSGTAGNGSAYRGGDSNNEGGGGGGGYYGGGDGGDNNGGGGGSSYIALLINGATSSGANCSGILAETVGLGNVVTYNSNSATSGTAPNEAIVPVGKSLTASANTGTLARTNYTFSGWNTAANGSGTTYAVGSTTFIPNANTTLYAQWNSTITYNANGATSGAAPTATTSKGTAANTTLQSKGTLVRTNFNFSGWNTLANGTGSFYAESATNYQSTGDITLYAQWTATTGTPTLDSASDTGNSATDKLTKDNTPTINVGALVPGATVTITATPASGTPITCVFTAGAAVSPATTSSGSCTFTTLPDATYSFTVSQSYNGGASTASTALAGVVIDTVRPTVTFTSTAILSGGNSLATPAAPSQNYNINAIFSKTVSGFVIGEITKNAESTGWEITTTALSTSALSSYTFNVRNATGAGNAAGKLFLSIAEGVATDAAGNTNVATASDFIINTVIQLTLTNQYQAGINPVVGGNNATVVQSSNGASVDLTGQGGVTRANHTFAGWSLVTTNGSGAVIPSPFTPTVPLFLYSSWVADTYIVSYNANGGNGAPTATSQNYTFGAPNLSLTTKGTLARTGYTFAGWNTLATGLGTNYLENASYKPTASIILYAKWTPGNYTVTLDRNGATGTAINGIAIVAGTAKSLSGFSYTRDGYTLLGWNSLADGTGTSYPLNSSVTFYADTTLYANWVPRVPGVPTVAISGAVGNTQITVAVTGAALSGTAGPASTYLVTASPGSATCTITSPATTCTFTGLTNGTAYTFTAVARNTTGNSASSASSAAATPLPWVVTYAANSGTVSPTSANFNLGTPLTLPLPTRSGYNFTGWNNPSGTSVGLNGGSYSPPSAITLTAQWSAIVYTISYSGNGNTTGTAPTAGSFSTGGSSHSISAAGNLAKSGYNFDGWTTASNGTGTAFASGAGYSTAANLVLYAKWTPQVYTITYDKNGAGGAPSKATDSFTFGSTPLTLPAATGMTYANYTFGGWSETSTGTAVISPYSPTQTRTLYAIWTGIQYSVSYNVNGGTGLVADAVYTTGATGLTLNDGSTLTRTGYNFGGWKNLAGTTVSGSLYIATENVTLYAIWTPMTIVVTYDKGIATTTPTIFPASPINTSFGSNFTLGTSDTSTVTSSGNYAFAGWKIGSDIYKPGDSYRISGVNPVTVTAQWIQLFEVTYNTNGGTFANGDNLNDSECGASKLCAINAPITLNATPTRTGFSFAGWVNQVGANFSAAASINVTETNYIFYATWTPNNYRITYAVGAGATSSAATAQTGNFGDIVTLASGANYTLNGSIFSGWLITSNFAAGALYTLGSDAGTLTSGTYELTATAQYANNTFKVFYNTNGSTAGNVPTATVAASGAAINLNDARGFSRSGFTFDGWSDGTNILAAGFSTTMGSANSTLIAQWKIALPVTPTISSVSGSDGGATVTVSAGSGGGTPSSYTVTSSPAGGSCTITAPATSCSVSPLTNGTAYTFSVTATNSTGTSAAATSAAITPAGKPDAPTGVTATVGNGSATVSFVAPASTGGPAITGYTITSSPAGATCSVGANATSYSCTGLTNGTAYTFAVTASNGIATSDASTSSLAATPATVPGTPTSVTATSSASGVATVSFTAPSNNGGSAITGYVVTSSPSGATCTVGANATTYSCSGLTDGSAYTFTVISTNSIGNSVGAVSASVTPQGPASAVTTISAVSGDGSAVITFSGANANGSTITGYTVEAYDSSGSAVTGATCTATTSATNGSCTITGLTNGSQYTFKAVTNSTANSSAVSSVASIATTAVTPAKAPEAPTGITTTAGTGKVTVGWTEPADNGSAITSYTVQAYDSAGNAVAGATCTATAPATTCDVSANLVAGSAYTFKVTATSAAGTSAASTASTSASVNAAPSAPRNVTAVKGNTTATVSWDAPLDSRGSDVTGYTVIAYTSGNVAAGTCTSVAPTETCVVTGLTNGTPYTFKVTATNGIGTSAQSTASSAATPSTVPNAPTGVTVASGDAQVTVSFTAPTNNGGSSVTGYTVTASDGSTISGTTSPLTITGLTNGTAYTFTVKATNVNGDSVASSASASTTPMASSIPVLVTPGQPTGNPYVGSTLTSNVVFSGSPTPTQTYQWKVCESQTDLSSCTNISGATAASFVPTISELGKYIVVVATATNRVGTATETSNPTLVINPEIAFSAPSSVPNGTVGTAYVLSMAAAGGVGTFGYTISNGTLPAGVVLDPATGQIAGTPTTAGTYTFTVRATDSNGVYKDVVVTITVAAATAPAPTTPSTPIITPPTAPTCDADCQGTKEAAATKAAADKAAADAIAKAAAEKAAADAAAAAKAAANTAATNASTKAAADAAAAAAAAKAAIDKAAAAAVAQAAADAAAAKAAADAAAAKAAQTAAAKAAADAAAALKNSTATAAAKAAATASANKAAADAAAAVKAAATAAQKAATAKTTAANATKQVDIAINTLTSKTASSQASAQANAIAAAAKAAADAAAQAAADAASAAKGTAAAAQKAASDTAARIATEQKQAADAAAQAKAAAAAAAKATAEKIAAEAVATKAAQELAKVLADKAALAEQAAKETDETARTEIQKMIEEVTTKVDEVQKSVDVATAKVDTAAAVQQTATQTADTATKEAQTQAAEAVAVKAESVAKTAEATKAVAAATVAAKVATAAKAAAAKIPSKATITAKPSTTTSKNSATATVTGLKPGQKVKVTVNVKDK